MVIALHGASAPAHAFTWRADDDPVTTEKILDAGPLKLFASCFQGGVPGGAGDVQLSARSARDGAMIHVAVQNDAGPGSIAGYGEDDFFNAGEADEFDLENEVYGGLDATTDATGQIVYRTHGGRVVTVDFMSEDKQLPGSKECLVAGTAAAPKPSAERNVYYRGLSGASDLKRIFKGGGMKLKARCFAGPDLEVYLYGKDGDTLHANSQSDVDHNGADEAAFFSNPFFIGGVAGPFSGGVQDTDSAGQMIYTNGKVVITIDYLAETSDVFDPSGCEFAATVRVAAEHSKNRVLYKRNAPDSNFPFTKFFSGGGLRLKGRCAYPSLNTAVNASTSSAHSTFHFDAQGDFDENGTDERGYGEADDFGGSPGSSIQFMLYLDSFGLEAGDNSSGLLFLGTRGGRVVSLDYLVDTAGSLGKDCLFAGVAVPAG